jgi:hypothetical protein
MLRTSEEFHEQLSNYQLFTNILYYGISYEYNNPFERFEATQKQL